jgi:predicted ATPase
MKLSLERIIIKNRAPFESLDLVFNENEIAVLTAVNGRGKTTILSYIVDAWHEIARENFQQEFEGRENKFYRVSSSIFNLNENAPSFVYIRFKYGDELVDYVDIRGRYTQEQYAEIPLEHKIPFDEFKGFLEDNDWVRKISGSLDQKKAVQIFNSNVITYFPAYRYEMPGYLNTPYKIDLDFIKEMSYSGYLPNPLEVTTGLTKLANWIMDVVLDWQLYRQTQDFNVDGKVLTHDITPEMKIWSNLNEIMRLTLSSNKYGGVLRFGIGRRHNGGKRIGIMMDMKDGGESKQVYPNIFNLSSGEAAMLCMFGEILRQADKTKNNNALQDITGIVLVDEIDKHLHIKLQKEVLPKLFNLFPNVQFIVSSHSPFLNMGLVENSKTKIRATIVDLEQNGIRIPVQENFLYKEVYQMMIHDNENYAKMYNELSSEQVKPVLVVEDEHTQIYKVAWLKLNDKECDINNVNTLFDTNANFCIYGKGGHNNLQGFLNNPKMDEWARKIVVGLFDFDDAYTTYQSLKTTNNWEAISDNETTGLYKKRKDCNVYAMMLPVPNFRKNIAGKNQIVKQLEVELLLTDDKIREAYGEADYATEAIIEGFLIIPKIKNKDDFWKKTLLLDKESFKAFEPLFGLLDKILTPWQGE